MSGENNGDFEITLNESIAELDAAINELSGLADGISEASELFNTDEVAEAAEDAFMKLAEQLEIEAAQNTKDKLSEQEAVAEALVFASGEPVKIDSIAIAINTDKKEAYKVMDSLMDRYQRRAGGIILRKIDKSYIFCTRPELTENLRPFFERSTGTGLSRAAMETLAVICYNQPVTRSGIEYVRGINSDGVLVRLIEKGLVEEVGRSEAPGRPILYGTTTKFLQSMGVGAIKDLPKVEKIIIKEKETEDKAESNKVEVTDEESNK